MVSMIQYGNIHCSYCLSLNINKALEFFVLLNSSMIFGSAVFEKSCWTEGREALSHIPICRYLEAWSSNKVCYVGFLTVALESTGFFCWIFFCVCEFIGDCLWLEADKLCQVWKITSHKKEKKQRKFYFS